MFIDVTKYFDFEAADLRYGFDKEIYYDVLLSSKSTGEIITFTFDRAHFDELLAEMEMNLIANQNVYEDYRRKNEYKNRR